MLLFHYNTTHTPVFVTDCAIIVHTETSAAQGSHAHGRVAADYYVREKSASHQY